MKKKCTQLGIAIMLGLPMLFSGCRQGLNDTDIDTAVVTHAKALVDFYSLNCSQYLKVYQHETKDYWLYYYSANWNTYFPEEVEPQLPSDLIKYKDKYLLFFIKEKKELDEKKLQKALGISSIDELPQKPQGCIDNRRWFYLKNKKTNESVFVQSEFGVPMKDIPELREFNFNDVIR